MTETTNCPKCKCEIEMDVDLGEHMVDVFDKCPECNYSFTESEKQKIYSDALASAHGTAIDHEHDVYKVRNGL